MSAVWLRLRSGWRSSARSGLLLVVLISVGGGCVLAAVSGARRTQTAMERFVAYSRPEDLSVFFDPTPDVPARVLRLPEVARATRLPYLMMSTDSARLGKIGVFGASDANALDAIDRPIVVRGRLADPRRAEEAVVNELAARQNGFHVGDRVTLHGFSPAQIARVSQSGFLGTERPAGPRYSVRVVGVIREPGDIAVVPVAQGTVYDSSGSLYTTPAFMRAYAQSVGMPFDALPGNEIVRVQLRRGASEVAAFTADVNRVAGLHAQILPGSDTRITAGAVQRGVNVEVIALLIFAALAAVAVIVLVGFSLSRLLRGAADDLPHLRALGMTRPQLLGVALGWPLAAVACGCAGAVVLSIVTSPLTPIGIARNAEIHPGISVNFALLAGALGVMFLLLVGLVIVSAINASRTRAAARSPGPRSRSADEALRRLGFSPVATLGVAAAWSRGQRVTLGRTAFAGVAIATAAVVAAVTFGTSLDHLVASPKQQGWTFDVVVGNFNDQNDQVARDVPMLARNHYVAGFSAVAIPPETPTIDGHAIGLVGVDEYRGAVEPLMLAGRFAHASNEITLGRASLHALRKHIGDEVTITAGPRHMRAYITGVALMLSAGSDFNGSLDEGAVTPLSGLKQLEPNAFVTVFFVRFARGVDRGAALTSIRRDFGPDMLEHIPAQDVENLARVGVLPGLLAALIAFLALVTLTHALFSSVNRRRRTLATLKALGLVRSQVVRSVFWQAAAITVVGIAIGVPTGVLIGRATWRFVADRIGSVQPPVVPLLAVGLCVAITAALGALVAIGPAVQATRTKAAIALRDE